MFELTTLTADGKLQRIEGAGLTQKLLCSILGTDAIADGSMDVTDFLHIVLERMQRLENMVSEEASQSLQRLLSHSKLMTENTRLTEELAIANRSLAAAQARLVSAPPQERRVEDQSESSDETHDCGDDFLSAMLSEPRRWGKTGLRAQIMEQHFIDLAREHPMGDEINRALEEHHSARDAGPPGDEVKRLQKENEDLRYAIYRARMEWIDIQRAMREQEMRQRPTRRFDQPNHYENLCRTEDGGTALLQMQVNGLTTDFEELRRLLRDMLEKRAK